MKKSKPMIPRKKPIQARSILVFNEILDSAAHILVAEGIQKLTTNRLAASSGLSIGSVYQYFPNKGSVLVQLHLRAVKLNWSIIETILKKSNETLGSRIDEAIRVFFRHQIATAKLHRAMHDFEFQYRDDPETLILRQSIVKKLEAFFLSERIGSEEECVFKAKFFISTTLALGHELTRQTHQGDAESWANATSKMLLCFLVSGLTNVCGQS